MANSYKTHVPRYIDYAYKPNIETRLALIDSEVKKDVAKNHLLSLAPDIQVEYLNVPGAQEIFKERQGYYNDEADKITESFVNKDSNIQETLARLNLIKKELSTDYNSGQLSQLQNQYRNYQKSYLGKETEDFRKEHPNRANAMQVRSRELINEAFGEGNILQDFTQYSHYNPFSKENRDAAKALVADKKFIQDKKTGEWIVNIEEVTPERIAGVFEGMGGEDIMNEIKLNRELGTDGYIDKKTGEPIPLIIDGKLNTKLPVYQDILIASGLFSHRQTDLKHINLKDPNNSKGDGKGGGEGKTPKPPLDRELLHKTNIGNRSLPEDLESIALSMQRKELDDTNLRDYLSGRIKGKDDYSTELAIERIHELDVSEKLPSTNRAFSSLANQQYSKDKVEILNTEGKKVDIPISEVVSDILENDLPINNVSVGYVILKKYPEYFDDSEDLESLANVPSTSSQSGGYSVQQDTKKSNTTTFPSKFSVARDRIYEKILENQEEEYRIQNEDTYEQTKYHMLDKIKDKSKIDYIINLIGAQVQDAKIYRNGKDIENENTDENKIKPIKDDIWSTIYNSTRYTTNIGFANPYGEMSIRFTGGSGENKTIEFVMEEENTKAIQKVLRQG